MIKTENIIKEIIKNSSSAEKEVERFLLVFLKGTEFANKAFGVGGYVRDELLGLEAKDLDIVVEMDGGAKKLTHFIKDELGDSISTPREMGKGYPIWQITFKEDIKYKGEIYKTDGAIIEFADTMKESFPDPSSRQRKTEPGTIDDDVARRDFTVNMLLKDLTSGEVKDLTGTSINDIKKGILRGHPGVSLDTIFNADPLRMIRLSRFFAKYDWQIPMYVLKSVKRNAERIKIVSAERVMDELKKVMLIGKLDKAINLMKVTGILKYILPEVEELTRTKQHKKHHSEGGTYKHTLLVLKNAPKTIEGQLAALLHDIGKPATQQILQDDIKFLGHEDVGADIAEAILRRLKFDNDVIKKVKLLVKNHMRLLQLGPKATEKALRKFIRDIGDELIDTIVDLSEADALGSLPVENYIPELRDRIKKIKESPQKVTKEPIISGQEIMDLLNINAGPKIGEIKKFLIDLEDDYVSTSRTLSKEEAKSKILEKFK